MRVASFQCDDEYELNGPDLIICENNGWNDKMPVCEGEECNLIFCV